MTLALAAQTRGSIAQLSTDILIPATPTEVWAVLADTARYPDWNPFIRALSGRLAAGETIQGHDPALSATRHDLPPASAAGRAGRELRWRGRFPACCPFPGNTSSASCREAGQTRLLHERPSAA